MTVTREVTTPANACESHNPRALDACYRDETNVSIQLCIRYVTEPKVNGQWSAFEWLSHSDSAESYGAQTLNNRTKNTHKFRRTKLQWKSIVKQSAITIKVYFESHISILTESNLCSNVGLSF